MYTDKGYLICFFIIDFNTEKAHYFFFLALGVGRTFPD